MAVLCGIYGDKKPEYEGCVLYTYERNGYEDSDWYAVCWDDEKQELVTINYDTTRAGGGGWAKIDITFENLMKVYRHSYNKSRKFYDETVKFANAKKVFVGDVVEVVKGRKIPKGTVGKVFWVGSRYNQYTRSYEDRVGIETDGGREFTSLEYVCVVDWESRVSKGKKRKAYIRKMTINAMPCIYRKYFDGSLSTRQHKSFT